LQRCWIHTQSQHTNIQHTNTLCPTETLNSFDGKQLFPCFYLSEMTQNMFHFLQILFPRNLFYIVKELKICFVCSQYLKEIDFILFAKSFATVEKKIKIQHNLLFLHRNTLNTIFFNFKSLILFLARNKGIKFKLLKCFIAYQNCIRFWW
jgi:hypothetical protein